MKIGIKKSGKKEMKESCLLLIFLFLISARVGHPADDVFLQDIPNNHSLLLTSIAFSADDKSGMEPGMKSIGIEGFAPSEPSPIHRSSLIKDQKAPLITRLKRAELFSLSAQFWGMGLLQAADAWHTGHRPFSDARDNFRGAWTTAPKWDEDSYFYNYLGHPYTGAFTYNLMRSQKSSPLASWLFSCSQSLIWEYTLEAFEQQPSVQDLLLTSNLGSLMGEGFHRLTLKMRENGLSWKEKAFLLLINPAYVLNNGLR